MALQLFAADIILIVHFAFVLFVVNGLALTWIGAWRGWHWIRSSTFRIAHLVAIFFVAGEALLGMTCPLTEWEYALRPTGTTGATGGMVSNQSFIARWVHRVMFFSAPEWVFTALYVAFALTVAATFWLIPPRRKNIK